MTHPSLPALFVSPDAPPCSCRAPPAPRGTPRRQPPSPHAPSCMPPPAQAGAARNLCSSTPAASAARTLAPRVTSSEARPRGRATSSTALYFGTT
eukprot:143870-Prymnesium_polylepis.1